MSTRPVLVTGASGLLGAQVMLALREHASAVAVARRPEAAPREVAGADWRAADLTETGVLGALVRALAPRAIIHCAALANAAECEAQPERASRVNAGLMGELAAAGLAGGARVVLVSTDLVFGAQKPPAAGFDEQHEPGPVSVYGASKRAGEERALEIGGDLVIARLPLLFGDSLGRGLGATDSLHAALERGETPTLFDDEWRTPLAVEDAAAALVELALAREGARGLLHIAGPQRCTRLELGLLALEARGMDPAEALAAVRAAPRASAGLAPERPADCSLDAGRARSILTTSLRSPREALRTA